MPVRKVERVPHPEQMRATWGGDGYFTPGLGRRFESTVPIRQWFICFIYQIFGSAMVLCRGLFTYGVFNRGTEKRYVPCGSALDEH